MNQVLEMLLHDLVQITSLDEAVCRQAIGDISAFYQNSSPSAIANALVGMLAAGEETNHLVAEFRQRVQGAVQEVQ